MWFNMFQVSIGILYISYIVNPTLQDLNTLETHTKCIFKQSKYTTLTPCVWGGGEGHVPC